MLIYENNSSKYVYHYTTVDTALNYILKSNTLKVSRMTNTNDPKESKSWLFEMGTNENANLDKYNMWDLSAELDDLIKTTTFLICFSKDQKLTGNHLNDLPRRGYGHSRMWAQYANNHSGVCLVFDNEKLGDAFHDSFKEFSYYAQNINYIDRYIGERDDSSYIVNIDYLEKLGLQEYALCHADTYKDRLFFEKLKDWENENEYRWVLFGEKGMDEPLFPFKQALKGIVFGASCPDDNIQKIVNLTHEMSLDYIQLKWRNCSPWYDFRKEFIFSSE